MSTSLPPLVSSSKGLYRAPFALYKPGKAPASFARNADIRRLIEDNHLGFFYFPMREDESAAPSMQPLIFSGAVPLVVAYRIEGFEPKSYSNLSLSKQGPFRVIDADSGHEIAKGEYAYDEFARQHKVGGIALPNGVKQVRYIYVLISDTVYRLKMNSTLEKGISNAIAEVYNSAGVKVSRVYASHLCQDEHFWSISQVIDSQGSPSFSRVTKEGMLLPIRYNGDAYFMPNLKAEFIQDPSLIEKINNLRLQIRNSFLEPRPAADGEFVEQESQKTKPLPAIDPAAEEDLPF